MSEAPPFTVAGRPCSAAGPHSLPCPWRRDTAGTKRMPARLATEDFGQLCGTAEHPVRPDTGWFICHKSSEREPDEAGRPLICAGWLAAVGRHHLGVRLAVLWGWLPPEKLENPPGGPPLFSSFEEMAAGHTFVGR